MKGLPSAAEVDRELIARKGFREFVRRAWPQVEPAPLVWGWHMDAICEHLEAVAHREIRDLVINIPPGTSKSLLSSVLWPAWVWTLDPARRFIVASYAERVVLRDARKNRKLVDGDWFQARFPEVQIPRDRTASTALSIFNTSQEGMRFSTTIPGGDVTGQHCHDAMVDDPINPYSAEAASGVGLDAVLDHWRGVMPTRFLDHATSTRTLTMQRVHERDLTTEFKRAGATVLCLPMRYERAHPSRYQKDPRTEEGELLCPARIPEAEVQRIEVTMGPTRVAAQLQQRPAPAGGNILKESWLLKRWVELPKGGTWGLSLDATFKDTKTSDLVALQAWLSVDADHYLVDQVLGRMSFVETLRALLAMAKLYPAAMLKLVEDKANGTAILNVLESKLPGLVAVNPDGGKEARCRAVEPLFAAGNVWLPDPERARYPDGRVGAPWVPAYVHELTTFPAAAHDDQVDATTQYLNHVGRNNAELLESAMKNFTNMFGGG
ncbi:MAG: phage terminase large subunit [Deltaproteobacteria bacterium]|nr:phage terminase large subunit [Deltaproteobacteria bacterium]MBK8696062.1 phage terminase large subunit [Deltaproteobacteria bacterium]MBP6829487.1 phage terminase large subunit [Deltaproteobacteria bacterium]